MQLVMLEIQFACLHGCLDSCCLICGLKVKHVPIEHNIVTFVGILVVKEVAANQLVENLWQERGHTLRRRLVILNNKLLCLLLIWEAIYLLQLNDEGFARSIHVVAPPDACRAKCVVLESKMVALPAGQGIHVDFEQALVDFVLAGRHFLGEVQRVFLPITQLVVVGARLVACIPVRFFEDHLTHLVDEEGLTGREQSKQRSCLKPLSRYELS